MGKGGKDPCPTCNGQGGWWETGNGKKDELSRKARWIKCARCNGTGVV